MCTSLQNIVAFQDRYSLQEDIQELFRPKKYPKFELKEFYSHQLHQRNEQFRFFVDILEEWNRKIEAEQIDNHFDTVLQKNIFIFNSLRNTIMRPPSSAHLQLGQLYRWFSNTPSRNIRIVGKKQKQLTQQDEDWIVRNTFKSDLPSEIDNYHRRIVCKFQQGRERPCQGLEDAGRGYKKDNIMMRTVKTQPWVDPKIDNERQKTRISKIENQLVRFEREQGELKNVVIGSKIKKARQDQRNTKDFYQACFSTGKTYFPKKKKTMKENSQSSSSLVLRKLAKTAGQKRRKHTKELTRLSAADNPSAEATLRKSEIEGEGFKEFQPCQIRLSEITGLRLMQNPLESKLKKKKRVK